MKKFLDIIKNKWLIKGTTTVILVSIVIACYIGLNTLVDKINVEDLDLTEKKLYSLSEETKTKVSNLNNEIEIDLINMGSQTNLKDYAKKYSALNKNIKIEEIDDLTSRLDVKTKYNLSDTDSLMVVKSGNKEKKLTSSDFYTYDYSTYKQIDTTEEAITNAIVSVTLEKEPKIYIYSGKTYYDSTQVLSTIVTKLKDESNQVDYLDILSKGEVPSDCDCLVITTLKSDFTELERDKIIEYISRGGRLMVLTSQNILNVDTPNFDAVLSQYGINIDYGAIFEQDSTKMLQNAPEMVITDVSASFMNDIDMAMKMCLLDPGKITFADEDKLTELGVEYEEIAKTSKKSYVRKDFNLTSYERTSSDSEEGESIVGAKVTKTLSDNVKSEVIIYSNELFATDMQIPVSSQYYMYALDLYNNKDVMLNSISYLTNREDTITIRKTDETESYTVNENENNIIMCIIFITPVVIIIAGIIVWQVRRRRK